MFFYKYLPFVDDGAKIKQKISLKKNLINAPLSLYDLHTNL